ncbi:MAG: RidA family protein [Acidobacteriota bacterium]|nr:RidA family protein [Acidobacteriota bacterium]
MNKEFLNPPNLPDWRYAFSQVVIVKAGGVRTIYIAGQVSVDEERKLVGAGNRELQAEQAFRNLTKALAAAGASTADVVKINIYVKHYQPSDAAIVGDAFRRAFPHRNLPVSTWLGVESLADEGFLIEVDAVAVVEE